MIKNIRIVQTAVHPDLDAVACALAYSYLLNQQGIKALPSMGATEDGEVWYHLDNLPEPVIWATAEQVKRVREFVLVDFSWLEELHPDIDRMNVVEVIDHHPFNPSDTDYPNSKNQIEEIGAAATLVVERFIQAGQDMPDIIAKMLYGAIYSNTQSLKGAVTKQRDIDAAEYLEREYGATMDIIRGQYQARTAQLLSDVSTTLRREFDIQSKGRYGAGQLELLDASDVWEQHNETFKNEMKYMEVPAILSIVDSLGGYGIHYINNAELQAEFLSHFPDVKRLDDNVFHSNPAILRKQIYKKMV